MDQPRMIGILMTRQENDMAEEFLANATRLFDRIFVLDGNDDSGFGEASSVYDRYDEIKLVMRDKDISGDQLKDGARHYLLEEVRKKYGSGHWIGVLHGDELYANDPRPFLGAADHETTPVIEVRLVHFFLHTSDEGTFREKLDMPVEQRITHYMWPGTLENRFFYDDGKCKYDPGVHSRTVPYELEGNKLTVNDIIVKHYNYRSPEQMYARAQERTFSGWQRNHYQHIVQEKLFFIDSLHVPGFDPCGWDNVANRDKPHLWSKPRSTREHPLPCLAAQ